MYAKILIMLVLVILCTGCTDPDMPDLDLDGFKNITPGAPALQKSWNPETQTITISTLDDTPRLTVRRVSMKPDLCTFEEVLEIKSFVSYELNELKDFRIRWQKLKGQHDISKVEWFILKNESYHITVDDYETIQVEETHYDNVTEEYYNVTANQTVFVGNHSEVRYHDVWKPFSPVGKSIHAGLTYTVKIIYHKPPELGNVRIQTIPMFAGVECEELTWWNSSWDYKIDNIVSDGARPYQFRLYISNTTNTNNATHVFGNGHFNSDYGDIRCTLDDATALEYGIVNDSVDPATLWINVTANGTVNIYYRNSAASTTGNLSKVVTGGIVTGVDDYLIHNFTASGTFVANGAYNVSALVVAGGGGGGGLDYYSGGGGAGGLLYNSSYAATKQSYSITVGVGGAKAPSSTQRGLNGGNSVFSTMTAIGGGGGAARTGETTGGNGGSGGGKGHDTAGGPGTGVSGQGYGGGSGYGGGGGGASEVGGTRASSPFGGDGGDGLAYSISGTSTYYAGGGGGGSASETRPGGLGGGGDGGYIDALAATDGTDGLGGGGGGGSLNTNGGDGGDGVVIIRYNNSGTWNAWGSESIIAAYTPSTPLSKTTGDSQLFTVNTSENSQCRWYINGSLKQTNSTDATRHEYFNSSLDEGYWNFTATANTTNVTSSQTWWVTVSAVGTFEQDMYDGRWMYTTYLDGSNTNLSEFFTDLSPYYLSFYNATDQKTYNYKSGRWEKYADKIIRPGEVAMMRYTSDVTKTRNNASGTFGFTMKTGLNHIGHSYNGTRNLSWYNTTITSANLVTIEHQNPGNGTISTFTYGSAENGTVEVLQGCGVEVNVSSDTVISGL